ncbi:integrase core domain-containing protein [Candidatus Saccharibacteria bacterium]|nr:integrase core domain-containing protein [Candidatus Saccharibacteria bacterium]
MLFVVSPSNGAGFWSIASRIYLSAYQKLKSKWQILGTRSVVCLNQANKAIQDWLDFYNQTRPHQALGYLSPNDKAKEDNQPILKPRQNKR